MPPEEQIKADLQASIAVAKTEAVNITPILKEAGYRRAEKPAFVSGMAVFFAGITPIVFASLRLVAAAHGWDIDFHENLIYGAYASGLASVLAKSAKDRIDQAKSSKKKIS